MIPATAPRRHRPPPPLLSPDAPTCSAPPPVPAEEPWLRRARVETALVCAPPLFKHRRPLIFGGPVAKTLISGYQRRAPQTKTKTRQPDRQTDRQTDRYRQTQ